MSKYIKLEDAKDAVTNTEAVFDAGTLEPYQKTIEVMKALDNLKTIDIVRCKDCVHYDPPHINDNGKRIEYSDLSTDLPQEDFCVAEHIVSAKYGVNVGGRCTVDYNNGYSEDKRVYRKETDFCSYGEREEK